MAHYLKSFTRVKAIMTLVVVACLSGIIGGFCGSLLTQKDRAKAKYSITNTKETLKKATTERDKLKREYARLISSGSIDHISTTSDIPSYSKPHIKTTKFYDPDRTFEYHSNDTSFHHTREDAIRALAEQFDRSSSWVERHIGTANDLQIIHQNLWRALLRSQEQSQSDTQVSDMTRKFEAEESPWAPLSRRLDEIDYDNRKKLEKYNRRPGQKGYSLGVRRAAAITTLMDKGYSREEAIITVREIEKQGMLPDPPAR